MTYIIQGDTINKQELFKKKSTVESPQRKSISQKRFAALTIEARKNGANIIRCSYGDDFYRHLEMNQATASCVGDTLIFRPDVTVSEVLEETFHFSQNLMQTNSDQPVGIRVLMNEIEAKEYIIKNAKKYSVPRSEVETLKAQLKNYKAELNKILGEE